MLDISLGASAIIKVMRILLIIEDSNQANSLKILLTKLGCVIETQSVELGLKDKIISFRPEVVITAGTGKKVNPLNVTQRVRESKSEIKVLLLLGKGMKISLNDLAENRYDAFIESPFDPIKLVSTLNKFRAKNSMDLVEKFQKIMVSSDGIDILDLRHVKSQPVVKTDEPKTVFNAKFSSTLDVESRKEKYEDLTFGIQLEPKSTITKAAVRSRLSEMQKDWDMQQLEDIDKEKRRFVNELFKKK